MSTSVLRTADAWWVLTPTGAAKVHTSATTTAELLADRPAIVAAATSSDTVPVDDLALVSPVTAPCRVVAQMTNFASHVKDTNGNPETVPLTFFRKTSGSISGPFADVVRPAHVTSAGLRGGDRARLRPRDAGRHDRHRGQPRRLRRGPGGHQRHLRT